jgi:sulfatase modifying factor 1
MSHRVAARPEVSEPAFNPYVPRPIDLPTPVPLEPEADLSALDEAKTLAAPDDPADWPLWREQLARWRTQARERMRYSDRRYEQSRTDCFVIGVVWLWDELLYDHDGGVFTVDAFVQAACDDFGGMDGVVLWHAYPIEGIDERRQFDFYRGVPELPDVVRALQRHGIQVFVVYYPWEPSEVSDVVALCEWTGADGVFLDSVKQGDDNVRAALDKLSEALSLEAESRLPLARVHDHTMSWAQWFADSAAPGVLRAKWFERRHVLHHTRRWHRSHVEEIQSAFLNGCGILIWECVFGVWVGWSARDKTLLKGMRRVLDRFTPWLQSEQWTPLADHPGSGVQVFASRWEHDGTVLWTIVNRGGDYEGPWLVTDVSSAWRWAEVAFGIELTLETTPDGPTVVSGRLPAGGIAAVVATQDPALVPDKRASSRGTDAMDFDDASPARAAIRINTSRSAARTAPPDGTRLIEGGRYDLVVRHRVRETGLYGEAPYVDEWKPLPPRLHHTGMLTRQAFLESFAISSLEVTNAEYAEFLAATHYRPLRPERFLAHWQHGRPPAGREDEPVTHVELADARVYAEWAGMRLPSEDEWQVAATAGLIDRGSPLVWNLTESEHTDGRTRFCILKGGCAFRDDESDWYFDGGVQPPEASAKLLLAGAGIGRSSSIGFRCAVDLKEES